MMNEGNNILQTIKEIIHKYNVKQNHMKWYKMKLYKLILHHIMWYETIRHKITLWCKMIINSEKYDLILENYVFCQFQQLTFYSELLFFFHCCFYCLQAVKPELQTGPVTLTDIHWYWLILTDTHWYWLILTDTDTDWYSLIVSDLWPCCRLLTSHCNRDLTHPVEGLHVRLWLAGG